MSMRMAIGSHGRPPKWLGMLWSVAALFAAAALRRSKNPLAGACAAGRVEVPTAIGLVVLSAAILVEVAFVLVPATMPRLPRLLGRAPLLLRPTSPAPVPAGGGMPAGKFWRNARYWLISLS